MGVIVAIIMNSKRSQQIFCEGYRIAGKFSWGKIFMVFVVE